MAEIAGGRAATAAALGRVAASNPGAAKPTVLALRERLHDFHERTRREAAGALAAALDPEDVELPLVTLEHPAEGRQYEEAMHSAVDRLEDFDDYAHRKLRKALEELNDDD